MRLELVETKGVGDLSTTERAVITGNVADVLEAAEFIIDGPPEEPEVTVNLEASPLHPFHIIADMLLSTVAAGAGDYKVPSHTFGWGHEIPAMYAPPGAGLVDDVDPAARVAPRDPVQHHLDANERLIRDVFFQEGRPRFNCRCMSQEEIDTFIQGTLRDKVAVFGGIDVGSSPDISVLSIHPGLLGGEKEVALAHDLMAAEPAGAKVQKLLKDWDDQPLRKFAVEFFLKEGSLTRFGAERKADKFVEAYVNSIIGGEF